MYNCKQIKYFILTDYVDEQLDAVSKKQVEDHLHQCAACQSFAREVKENLIVPFEQAIHPKVPDYVWQNIQQHIQEKELPKSSLWESVQAWLGEVSFPRLMPAFGSFVVIVLLGSTFLLNQTQKQAQDQEQISYLTYIVVSSGSVTQSGIEDQGTPIEKYFL